MELSSPAAFFLVLALRSISTALHSVSIENPIVCAREAADERLGESDWSEVHLFALAVGTLARAVAEPGPTVTKVGGLPYSPRGREAPFARLVMKSSVPIVR